VLPRWYMKLQKGLMHGASSQGIKGRPGEEGLVPLHPVLSQSQALG
jgi:hypothetical protein